MAKNTEENIKKLKKSNYLLILSNLSNWNIRIFSDFSAIKSGGYEMARKRLTDKTAEWLQSKPGKAVMDPGTGIDNDPYNMNDTGHGKNDPKMDQYASGDPSAWGEDVNKDGWWEGDEPRNKMNVAEMGNGTPKNAAQAIKAARQMEERAYKCIVASQRILPGAPDGIIEAQAMELLNLPASAIDNMLGRQEKLAKIIAEAAEKAAEDNNDDDEGEGDDNDAGGNKKSAGSKKKKEDMEEMEAGSAKKKKDLLSAKKAAIEELKAKLAEEEAKLNEDEEDTPSKPSKDVREQQDDEKDGKKPLEATKVQQKDEEMMEEEAKSSCKSASKEIELTASSDNLLDDIFSSVTASEEKKGAKTLSGIVKKEASEGKDPLAGLWRSDPDVSSNF